jgi:hypothetical protein
MHPRAFTTISAAYHQLWISGVLKLPHIIENGGIDCYDENTGVELKTRLRKWNPTWTIDANQISMYPQQNPGKELYWAFILYGLKKPISGIRGKDLPQVFMDRSAWLMPWEWVRKFPVWNPKTGPYVYVHQKDLPDNTYFSMFAGASKGQTGVLYVPKNSSLEDRLR